MGNCALSLSAGTGLQIVAGDGVAGSPMLAELQRMS